jgi:hypothetical protein
MTAPAGEDEITGWDWLGVALLTVCGGLAAVLESLLVPLYWGSVIFPIAIVLALASNVVFPRLASSLIPRTSAVLAPFAGWLVVVVGFGVLSRPEGDVILPGAPGKLEFVTYGVLLGGALAGTMTVVLASPPKSVNR